jgi:hypothetical protein
MISRTSDNQSWPDGVAIELDIPAYSWNCAEEFDRFAWLVSAGYSRNYADKVCLLPWSDLTPSTKHAIKGYIQ